MADSVNCLAMTPKFLGMYWKTLFMVIYPLALLPIFVPNNEPKFKCLYVLAVMSGYWITECIPLAITGLLPMVLFPLLGVESTGAVAINYFKDTNMIFMASVMIAISFEFSNLHIRIALLSILKLGCGPRALHFGMMFISMVLSMWLVNSATTAMMCPIITAILLELEAQGIIKMHEPPDPQKPNQPLRPTELTQCYFLGVAWASNIGGTACLVGTGTNLSYKGIYEARFPEDSIPFVEFLYLNAPHAIASTFLVWMWMEFQLMGLGRPNSVAGTAVRQGAEHSNDAYVVVQERYKNLGPMRWNEIGVMLMFLFLVLLWFFREPMFMPGWSTPYKTVKISDSTPAVLGVTLMIMIPSTCGWMYFCSKDPEKRPTRPSLGLLTWEILNAKMPWGLLFLLGGGFALADASNHSGLSEYLGSILAGMNTIPPVTVLLITSLFAAFLTEVTSNVAVCNIVIPVLVEMSIAMRVHPKFYTYIAALDCSYAFLLPSGTPPNAIVAGAANITTWDMVKAGFMPKMITYFVVFGWFLAIGDAVFEWDKFPEWADPDFSKTTTVNT